MKTKKQLIDCEHKVSKKHSLKLRFTLLSLCILTFIGGYSQTGQVNLNLKNATVKELFKEIEKQTSYRFSFRDIEVNDKKGVTISAQGKELKELLTTELAKQQLSYIVSGNKIIVSPAKKDNKSIKDKKVTGKVIDTKGDPIIGATIMEKGTTNGTVTDFDGNFILNVSENSTLDVSYIGFQTQSVKAVYGKNLAVVLNEDAELLDEVVVTGYISQKKVNLTGAVSTVSGNELSKVTTSSSAQALQGKLPGVQITATSGLPGASTQIQVRGKGTVNSGANPLVIIDGFEGSMDNLQMNDIESISVLKDAASAAIYGSKAANGVILITTKRGVEGKTKVEFSAEYGWQNVSHMPEVLNATELAIKQNEEAKWNNQALYWDGANAPATLGEGFNWWKNAINENAPIQNYNVSLRGGAEKIKYAVSVGYIDQDGIVPHTDYNRTNFRSNIDYNFNKNLKLGINLDASVSNNTSREMYNYFKNPLMIHPSVPQYMPDGSYGLPLKSLRGQYDTGAAMPLTSMYENDPNYVATTEGKNYQTRANFFLEWDIIDGLKSKTVYNFHYGWQKSNFWSPSYTVYDYETPTSIYDSRPNAEARSSYQDTNTWEFQQLLTYNKEIKGHNIGLLGGFVVNEATSQNILGTKQKFPGNELTVLDAGENITNLVGTKSRSAIVSLFGQVNYDYQGKYLLQANIRRDGSSVFAPGNQWGTFPSISAGWRISEEKFMKNISWLSNLKIRAGYGSLGNANIKQFAWISSYTLTDRYPLGNPNAVYSAYTITDMSSKDIKWETTTTFDIGIDASFFNNRLSLTYDWYDKRTKDMLFNATIPYSTGFINGPMVNVGEVMNRGWELNIGWSDKIKDFSYSISANISDNKNEVVDMGDIAPFTVGTDLWIKEGYPINSYFGYKTVGIYQNWDQVENSVKPNGDVRPGMYIIENTNGDNIINADDKTYLGSREPRYVYGINLSAEYKGIDLSISTSGESKKYVYYSNTYGGENPRFINIYKEYFDNRTIVGDDGNVAVSGKYPAMNGLGTNAPLGHSNVLQNTSFFRVKNIQVGYTLPKQIVQKIKVSDLRFFINAVNPFLFTKYVGFDPETTSNESDGTIRYYPVSKSISVGISLKL